MIDSIPHISRDLIPHDGSSSRGPDRDVEDQSRSSSSGSELLRVPRCFIEEFDEKVSHEIGLWCSSLQGHGATATGVGLPVARPMTVNSVSRPIIRGDEKDLSFPDPHDGLMDGMFILMNMPMRGHHEAGSFMRRMILKIILRYVSSVINHDPKMDSGSCFSYFSCLYACLYEEHEDMNMKYILYISTYDIYPIYQPSIYMDHVNKMRDRNSLPINDPNIHVTNTTNPNHPHLNLFNIHDLNIDDDINDPIDTNITHPIHVDITTNTVDEQNHLDVDLDDDQHEGSKTGTFSVLVHDIHHDVKEHVGRSSMYFEMD